MMNLFIHQWYFTQIIPDLVELKNGLLHWKSPPIARDNLRVLTGDIPDLLKFVIRKLDKDKRYVFIQCALHEMSAPDYFSFPSHHTADQIIEAGYFMVTAAPHHLLAAFYKTMAAFYPTPHQSKAFTLWTHDPENLSTQDLLSSN